MKKLILFFIIVLTVSGVSSIHNKYRLYEMQQELDSRIRQQSGEKYAYNWKVGLVSGDYILSLNSSDTAPDKIQKLKSDSLLSSSYRKLAKTRIKAEDYDNRMVWLVGSGIILCWLVWNLKSLIKKLKK